MECMTVERASKKLHMEKAEFIGAAIYHDVWIGIILGPEKMRFFNGGKLQPFLICLDAAVNTEKLLPLYVEYPDSDLGYMPRYDYLLHQPTEVSINHIRIPHKELNFIKQIHSIDSGEQGTEDTQTLQQFVSKQPDAQENPAVHQALTALYILMAHEITTADEFKVKAALKTLGQHSPSSLKRLLENCISGTIGSAAGTLLAQWIPSVIQTVDTIHRLSQQ